MNLRRDIMENLRNHEENGGVAGAEAPEYVSYEDDDSAIEAPPAIGQDERRMHVRAYNFWAGLLQERQFPSVEDLNPEDDEDFGPNSVLLDFTSGVENPSIQFVGEALRKECDIDETIETIDDVPARSLLSRITDHYLQIIANQAPIGFEAEFVNQRGITILYRGILLPFSTDDDNIDFIYGVINWKEAADDEIQKEIQDEVAQALQTVPGKTETVPVWADGPTSSPLEPIAEPVAEPVAEDAEDTEDELLLELSEDASLADWLCAARNSADHAADCEHRSRSALYAAISQAYDFYLMTEAHPEDYAELLEDSGLTVQERAPMTPIVKLVFGAEYDKTRLTEYAAALRYAKQAGIGKGEFADHIEKTEGGLKAIVYKERLSRKPVAEQVAAEDDKEQLLSRLRAAPAKTLAEIETGDAEFVVLVARREVSGDLSIVGPVVGDKKLTERALKQADI